MLASHTHVPQVTKHKPKHANYFPVCQNRVCKKKNLTATSVTRNNAKAVHTYGTQLMILLNETGQLLEQ